MLYLIDDIDEPGVQGLPSHPEKLAPLLGGLTDLALANLRAYGISVELISKQMYHDLETTCSTSFRVALAEKSLFPAADHYLNITRGVVRIADASGGPFHLIPREGHISVETQLTSLAAEITYSNRRSGTCILDDGIGGSGMTIRRVCEVLATHGHLVSEILVGLSNRSARQVAGIPIRCILQLGDDDTWMNLRDLIWGFPNSGVTLLDQGSIVGGIPYGLNCQIAAARAVAPTAARSFCEASAKLSCVFWNEVSMIAGEAVTLRMLPRLDFLSRRTSGNNSVVEFIQWIRSIEFCYD
jgi:hypothetical protein